MKFIKFAIASAALAIALPASAAVVVDGSPTGSPAGVWSNASNGQNFLVKFTLAAQTNVTGFDVFTSNFYGGLGEAVRIKIRADADGSPLGSNLFSFDDIIDVSTLFSGETKIVGSNFDAISLASGTYWMGMSGLNGELGWASFDNGGPSQNPNQRQLSGDIVSRTPQIDDLAFRVRAEDQVGAVPEPATWMMMMLGMAAVGFSLRRKQEPALSVRFA